MRVVSPDLETALQTGVRLPVYKLLAFDKKADTWADIVAGTYQQTPLDLTPYCSSISWQPAQMSFRLADPDGEFHPDTGEYKSFVEDGAIVRLLEGDRRVPESEWMWTFTGAIKGQLGWQKTRSSQTLAAQVTVYNRDNTQSYKRRKITTAEYTVGTDLGIMFHDIATNFMGLSENEVRISSHLGRHFMHSTNQIVQNPPWDSLVSILEVVSQVPFFDGDGRLTSYQKDLARYPDRVLPDYVRVYDYQVPARTQDVINKVIVIFLDANLSEVVGDSQVLGNASITTGFFTFEEKIPCYWSEDRRQRAKNTYMRVIKSVNDNLLPVGEESYQQNDEYHGTIRIEIYVWVPTLAGALLASYVANNLWQYDLVNNVTQTTYPIGRWAAAVSLAGILVIMMSLGSAQYEIWGQPYDMVYLEKKSIAIEDGLDYWDEIEMTIENDFIGTHEQADTVAVTELVYQKSSGNQRRLIIDDDLALELGDIVEMPDGRRFFITNMSKTVQRGEVPKLTLEGFKVLRI